MPKESMVVEIQQQQDMVQVWVQAQVLVRWWARAQHVMCMSPEMWGSNL